MRSTFSTILILILFNLASAQAPPVIEWQKCFGGSGLEWGRVLRQTSDGGYILSSYTTSNDGDVTGYIDSVDAWIIKLDATGTVQWKRCYGGTGEDYVNDILQTPDGGYIFAGRTSSHDGAFSNNNGLVDVWVCKVNALGDIEWQNCYGSTAADAIGAIKICVANTGGYIVLSQARSNGGDVTGYHSPTTTANEGDVWIIKIDLTGNLQWQKCMGGSKAEFPGALLPTSGGYIVTAHIQSVDGDFTCSIPPGSSSVLWIAKIDENGIILWERCLRLDASALNGTVTRDGGFIFTGVVNGPNLLSNLYIVKTDATGLMQWEKSYGGSGYDVGQDIIENSSGGYIVTGVTTTAGEIICNFKGGVDLWLMKVDGIGNMMWQKTYGGSRGEEGNSILQTADGGYLVSGMTQSDDGDIDLSVRLGYTDVWLVKFNFPGIEIIPEITITASETNICPGKKVSFVAQCVDEGNTPQFQWKVNGSNVGSNSNTLELTTLVDGDIVTCVLTSSSPCVTQRNVLSNPITISVDPTQTPFNFLGLDTAICEYGKISLKATGTYKNYLWNTGATTPVLIIDQPGTYWLDVMTNNDCPGVDTVFVAPKDCLKGFFMPTAFSPNNDGRNDVLKPILGGKISVYQLSIFNRWGQRLFETTDPEKGWDGKLNGQVLDGNVFIWTCRYQFEGEPLKLEKGTVALIR